RRARRPPEARVDASRGQPDRAQVLRGRVRRRDRQLRRLRADAGHVDDAAEPGNHHRHAARPDPPAPRRRRRRLRHPLAGLPGILRADARRKIALTKTTPTTAWRGAGRPGVSCLVERLVDEAARQSGIDRIELRRRNLIPKEAFPYKTPTSTYDSGDPPGLLHEVLKQSDWERFESRREEAKKRGKLRGIGCAMFVEPAGAGGSPKEEVEIRFGDSGNAGIYAVAGPSGQGHETVYPEVAAEILGMDAEKIFLHASDPDGPALMGDGTIGSRSMMAYGGAIAVASREVVRKGMELAAKSLEVSRQDLEFHRGRYSVKGTDVSITLEEIARR